MTLRRGVIATGDLWWLDAAIAAELPDYASAEPVYEAPTRAYGVIPIAHRWSASSRA